MTDNDIINKIFIQPDYDTRTFESRLLFMKDLFEHTFDKSLIMGRCIQYKLRINYDHATKEIEISQQELSKEDPLTVLRYLRNKR